MLLKLDFCFYFFINNTLFVTKIAITVALYIYKVNLTYVNICDGLQGYQDIDLGF